MILGTIVISTLAFGAERSEDVAAHRNCRADTDHDSSTDKWDHANRVERPTRREKASDDRLPEIVPAIRTTAAAGRLRSIRWYPSDFPERIAVIGLNAGDKRSFVRTSPISTRIQSSLPGSGCKRPYQRRYPIVPRSSPIAWLYRNESGSETYRLMSLPRTTP